MLSNTTLPASKPRIVFPAVALSAVLLTAACGTGGSTGTTAAQAGATSSAASGSSSPAASGTVSITDAQNRTVEVPKNPTKVVALDWSAIRTLNDLGVEVAATPQPNSSLPSDLAKYEKSTHVGTLFEPDYEAIAAMDPDLVIVGSRSGTPEVVAELQKAVPAVIDMSVRAPSPAETFTTTKDRVNQLASIFGKEAQATELMDAIAADIAQVKSEAAASAKTAMVVQVSDGTVSAYGPGSRFGTVFHDFGFQPVDAPLDAEGGHGDEISQEFFVEYNPGVLFVLDRAKVVGQKQEPALDILDNALVGSTDAAKNDKIKEIDGFSWYIASSAPSSWQQMVTDVGSAL